MKAPQASKSSLLMTNKIFLFLKKDHFMHLSVPFHSLFFLIIIIFAKKKKKLEIDYGTLTQLTSLPGVFLFCF